MFINFVQSFFSTELKLMLLLSSDILNAHFAKRYTIVKSQLYFFILEQVVLQRTTFVFSPKCIFQRDSITLITINSMEMRTNCNMSQSILIGEYSIGYFILKL